MSRRRGGLSPNRKVTKREVEPLRALLVELGENLLEIRDSEGHRAEGFASFEEWLRIRGVPMVPAVWRLSPASACELLEGALLAAEDERHAEASRG
jgi:hypothetical protein